MANRSVKTFKSNTGKKEPIIVSVDGEEFTAVPSISGITFLEFASSDAKSNLDFLKLAFEGEEFDRFYDFAKESGIELSVINDLTTYLIEEYSDRPTK